MLSMPGLHLMFLFQLNCRNYCGVCILLLISPDTVPSFSVLTLVFGICMLNHKLDAIYRTNLKELRVAPDQSTLHLNKYMLYIIFKKMFIIQPLPQVILNSLHQNLDKAFKVLKPGKVQLYVDGDGIFAGIMNDISGKGSHRSDNLKCTNLFCSTINIPFIIY